MGYFIEPLSLFRVPSVSGRLKGCDPLSNRTYFRQEQSMKPMFWAAGAAISFALVSPAVHAQALPIVGGVTSVTLTAAPTLVGAGLSVAGVGTAQISPGSDGIPLAYFPVTGGSINTATFAGSIQHAGSGLSLTSSSASATLTNFLINTVTGTLSGVVSFGGTTLNDVPLFTLGSSGVATSPFSLTLTPTAGAALATIFGIPNLAGAVIGSANSIPITAAVPEPATAASMLAGLALLSTVLARRRGLGGEGRRG